MSADDPALIAARQRLDTLDRFHAARLQGQVLRRVLADALGVTPEHLDGMKVSEVLAAPLRDFATAAMFEAEVERQWKAWMEAVSVTPAPGGAA